MGERPGGGCLAELREWAPGGFQAVGEEAGFEGVHAEQGVLGEGDAFDGEAFLGVVLSFHAVRASRASGSLSGGSPGN